MRKLAILLLLFVTPVLAVPPAGETMTPMRLAVIHKPAAPSTSPGGCLEGTSPDVLDDSTGTIYRCNVDTYEAISTGALTGSGTTGRLPKWASSSSLGDSLAGDDGAGGLTLLNPSSGFKATIDTSLIAMDLGYKLPDWADDPFFPNPTTLASSLTDNHFYGANDWLGLATFKSTTRIDFDLGGSFGGLWDGGTHGFAFTHPSSGLQLEVTTPTSGAVDAFTVQPTNALDTGSYYQVWREYTGTFRGGIDDAGFHGDVLGNCSTATALFANGGNCSSGSVAQGVNTLGAAEGCTLLPVIDNTAYNGGTWNGNSDGATKDAIRDKFESLPADTYTLMFSHPQTLSPADATTYFWGATATVPITTSAQRKVYIRRTGTIRSAEYYTIALGTAGSNESLSIYVRVNDTTDYLIATVSASTAERDFSNAAINITVIAGDFIELKMVCPTWATNPTNLLGGGYLLVE
jgi:hypothetical protein